MRIANHLILAFFFSCLLTAAIGACPTDLAVVAATYSTTINATFGPYQIQHEGVAQMPISYFFIDGNTAPGEES